MFFDIRLVFLDGKKFHFRTDEVNHVTDWMKDYVKRNKTLCYKVTVLPSPRGVRQAVA
jgi:hypothetical protein